MLNQTFKFFLETMKQEKRKDNSEIKIENNWLGFIGCNIGCLIWCGFLLAIAIIIAKLLIYLWNLL